MNKLTKWLAAALAFALVAAGWLYWQQRTWQHRFYVDTAGLTLQNVRWAHTALLKASEADSRERKAESMANAQAHLNAAFSASMRLFDTMFPSREGQVVPQTPNYIYALLQYARDLSPDLPPQQVARRTELLGGLAGALEAGFTEEWTGLFESGRLDRDRMMTALKTFMAPHEKSVDGFPPRVRFDDPPVPVSIRPRLEGSTLTLRMTWDHTYRIFPRPRHDFLLIRSGTISDLGSDQAIQDSLGSMRSIRPFSRDVTDPAARDRLFGTLVPAGWTPESYSVVGILPGLNQTLTLTLPAGTTPELLLVQLYEEAPLKAVPIPLGN